MARVSDHCQVCGSGPKGSRHEYVDLVLPHLRVPGDKQETLVPGLSYEHAIEGITMQGREDSDGKGVLGSHGK